MNYQIWPIASTINFYLIPMKFQVLFSNCVGLFWNTFLSYLTHKWYLFDININNWNAKEWSTKLSNFFMMQDIKNMSVRQYLDNTVVPIILQAMTELAKERYN